jgi:fructose-bisphosphate aldolase class I
MNYFGELESTIKEIVRPGHGILAADESSGTIAKRFNQIDVESTEENRRFWRSLLVTAPDLGDYISGIILFEETLDQLTDTNDLIPEAARQQGIIPGIKVDKGKGDLALSPGDLITYGLDGLSERLRDYKSKGARFAKWREVYSLVSREPTEHGIQANAEMLARYAAVCQSEGLVPIVEPEVLMDGNHEIDRHAAITEKVLHAVFHALHRHNVITELILLKPNMVLPGKECRRAKPDEVAEATLKVLNRTVPASVPSINFLSGGQQPQESTENLNAINQVGGKADWLLSISFGRALQEPALRAWRGKPENVVLAQQALVTRAKLNHLAMAGEYRTNLEQD